MYKIKPRLKWVFFFHKFSLLLTIAFCCVFQISASDKVPKIYDCFLFFNELEILEIKLNELYNHVDHFVLVESTETFRGNPKPLLFEENKQKFSQFLDKIIHIVVAEHLETNDPWQREAYQRNQILKGLTGCDDNDIVIIEDLDEIVRASKLPELIAPLLENRSQSIACNQTIYTYFLNRYGHRRGSVTNWHGSVAAKYAYVKTRSPNAVRIERKCDESAIHDAGWHFTYMGGLHQVRKKLESFSHSELDNEPFKQPQRILEDIEALKLVEIDETYPQFVRDHIPYFRELGLIDTGTLLPEPYNNIDLLPFDPHGWYRHAEILEEFFKKYNPKVVVEVGCWFGLSTRHIASLLQKGGILYAIDHWLGSAEQQPGQPGWHPKLPYLYEQFLSNVIHARLTHKIVPLRMSSLDGSKFLVNFSPDLIYLDASHDYDSVYSDIAAWFPLVKGHGILCGDDYLDGPTLSIKRAVDQFAVDNHLNVRSRASFWYYQE
jgi:beta-1,4-mannosyl-glycoprotein beta-1,4-N-acetylglucosaminyltransferase